MRAAIGCMSVARDRILVVTGLALEARIAAAHSDCVIAVAGGGDTAVLNQRLEAAMTDDVCAVLSFGIAGALVPQLTRGACIVARAVLDGNTRRSVDAQWSEALAKRLGNTVRVDVAGVDRLLTTATQKRALHVESGAAAVDMESHIAARFAQTRGLRYSALRVVADAYDRALPLAAHVGLTQSGGIDFMRVSASILRRPSQLALLARIAVDASVAMRTLQRCCALLDERLALRDFDELALDVL